MIERQMTQALYSQGMDHGLEINADPRSCGIQVAVASTALDTREAKYQIELYSDARFSA